MKTFLILVVCIIHSTNSYAQSCFLDAQRYYEQMYCEIKSKGKGRSLPSFIEFKKNNELTQALLLKRDALALRLDFKMPPRKSIARKKPSEGPPSPQAITITSSRNTNCLLKLNHIQCGDSRFELVGNLHNRDLSEHALSQNNRLELERFGHDSQSTQEYERYLSRSYIQYLDGMQSIGLGGVTMSYGRFYGLFTDLEEKGVDARARFAQMFEYLKQDKARNAINTQIILPDALSLNDCAKLNSALYACDYQRRNYLFVRSSGTF